MKYPMFVEPEQLRAEPDELLERKVSVLLAAMTPEEKLNLCHGHSNPPGMQVANAGYNPGVPRLEVPEIRMFDGPAGVTSVYETTGLPVQEMLAASWDTDLAYKYGKVEGSENFAISGNTQLGSQFDVVRVPQFSRDKDMLGRVNPSGKLALTMPARDTDTLVTDIPEHRKTRYEGYERDGKKVIDFDEGIFTGYRWYDKNGVKPLYAFGHGLSYTSFAYSNLKVDGRSVTFTVTNTGPVPGSEVAQVYLGAAEVPEGIQMAEKQLCGFARLEDMEPGASRTVTVTIPERSFCYWDANQPLVARADGTRDKWVRTTGARAVFVGPSSDRLLLRGSVE